MSIDSKTHAVKAASAAALTASSIGASATLSTTANRTSKTTAKADALPAWLSVVRCYQLCNDEIAAGLKPLGLKIQHFDVLARLAMHPGQTQAQLAQTVFVVKSHISTLINEMVALGWVLRTDSTVDRRSNTVSLTPLGLVQFKKAAKIQRAVMTAMFEPLLPRQIAAMETSASLVTQALVSIGSKRKARGKI